MLTLFSVTSLRPLLHTPKRMNAERPILRSRGP
uniref:Uncharacterized protein n=1 Tax=Anguilla anguilla TaxID=7936 RepID=A0A0E9TB01_ANGAN